ncbi:MAG: hypothetical protein M0Q38_15500 [Bacteroidales bacterium]|jgi:hypothetical protein|nr:hypothetical protein [Bacteroidales bacterium]
MEKDDFTDWLYLTDKQTGKKFGNPDWREIAWLHNTGMGYQHKQDLIAVFKTTSDYIEEKFEAYYKENKTVPIQTFDDLIYEFRKHFPLSGRVEGVNYFDDRIVGIGERYAPKEIKERYIATNSQIAVFFFCLAQGKIIKYPTGKPAFEPLLREYKFPGRVPIPSYKDISNLFILIGTGRKKDPLTMKNITFCIDHLLDRYPSALRIAEDQLKPGK